MPRLFPHAHEENWMAIARKFFEMFQSEGENLFGGIITGDENWVHHTTLEIK